jgi:anti-sigma B factor antagonist
VIRRERARYYINFAAAGRFILIPGQSIGWRVAGRDEKRRGLTRYGASSRALLRTSLEPVRNRVARAGESVGVKRWKSNRMPAMEIEPFRVVTQPGTRDGLHVLTLRGALTSTSSPAFTEAVIGVAAPRLIVDLTGVPTVDSVAIGALVRAFVSCHKSGRKLALVGMNHRVQNVLHITGIAPLFDSYETVAQAEQALG